MFTRIVTALKLTLRLIRYFGIDMFQYSNEEVPPVSVKQGHSRGSLFLTMQIQRVSFTKLTFAPICDKANKYIPTEMNKLAKVFQNFRINMFNTPRDNSHNVELKLLSTFLHKYNMYMLRDVSYYGTTTSKHVYIGVLVVLNTESCRGHRSAKFACLALCYCKDLKVDCISTVCSTTLPDFPTLNCFPISNVFKFSL